MNLSALVSYLIHGNARKVYEHNLCDRSQSGQCGPQGRPHDRCFRNRRIQNPGWPKGLIERGGRLEDPAELPDIFPHDKYRFVTGHFFSKGLTYGFSIFDLPHFIYFPFLKVIDSRQAGYRPPLVSHLHGPAHSPRQT